MAIRTTEKTVTFRRPFTLSGLDGMLPNGAYSVETDEEILEGISFPAYRRILTLIHLPPNPGKPGLEQTLTIDPAELDAALKRDRAPEDERSDSLAQRQNHRIRKKDMFAAQGQIRK